MENKPDGTKRFSFFTCCMSKADSALASNAPSSSTLLVSFTTALFWILLAIRKQTAPRKDLQSELRRFFRYTRSTSDLRTPRLPPHDKKKLKKTLTLMGENIIRHNYVKAKNCKDFPNGVDGRTIKKIPKTLLPLKNLSWRLKSQITGLKLDNRWFLVLAQRAR